MEWPAHLPLEGGGGVSHGIEISDFGIVFRTVQDWVLKVGIRAGFGSRTVGNAGIFIVNYFLEQFSGQVSGLLNG